MAAAIGAVTIGAAALPPSRADAQVQMRMIEPLTAPLSEEELEQALSDLDSEQFETREAATTTLLTNSGVTLKSLENVLKERELSMEQRQRLLAIARGRFMSTSRAAMGVQFMQDHTPGRIVVQRTIDKFASRWILEPGDMIVEADGIPINGPWAFRMIRAIIISRDPGDTIEMVVRRGSETKKLRVPLGRFEDLEVTTATSYTRLARAWEIRTRTYDGSSERITLDGAPEQWGGRDVEGVNFEKGMGEARDLEGKRIRTDVFMDNRLAGGGVARQTRFVGDGTTPMGEMAVVFRNGRAIPNDPRMGFVPMAMSDDPIYPAQTVEEELQAIQAALDVLNPRAASSPTPEPVPGGGGENADIVVIRSGQPLPISQQVAILERVRAAILTEQEEKRAASRVEAGAGTPDAD